MRIWMLAISLVVMNSALSAEKYNYALLPPYCKARLDPDNNKAEFQQLSRQFGGANWGHMHHYCYAADFWIKYRNARTEQDRRFHRNSIRTNLEYIVTHTRPDFFMRPQVYLELAEVHRLSSQHSESAKYLQNAINFNPRYAPAHVALVALFQQQGANAAALEAATLGLRYLPQSSSLQNLYLALGGRKPFPEPVVEQPPPSLSESTPQEEQPQESAELQSDRNADTPKEGEGVATTDPNSGCRFCPPEEIQQRWRESFEPSQ